MKKQVKGLVWSILFATGLFIICPDPFAFAHPASALAQKQSVPAPNQQPAQQQQNSFDKTAKLKVTVIDGRTRQPLPGAEVVLGETERRYRTDANGETPWIDAPVIRDERFRPMIAQLHGQLTLITYKNGYRDSIYFNVRVHEGIESRVTVWMYKITPGEDRRIEPLAYETPYHHLWLVQLADKFRSSTQPGEGPERP
jgi:hypothetical protein